MLISRCATRASIRPVPKQYKFPVLLTMKVTWHACESHYRNLGCHTGAVDAVSIWYTYGNTHKNWMTKNTLLRVFFKIVLRDILYKNSNHGILFWNNIFNTSRAKSIFNTRIAHLVITMLMKLIIVLFQLATSMFCSWKICTEDPWTVTVTGKESCNEFFTRFHANSPSGKDLLTPPSTSVVSYRHLREINPLKINACGHFIFKLMMIWPQTLCIALFLKNRLHFHSSPNFAKTPSQVLGLQQRFELRAVLLQSHS